MSQSEAFFGSNWDLIAERPLERLTRGRVTSTQQNRRKKRRAKPQKAIRRIINEISVNISEIKYLTADDDKKFGFVSASK